MYTVRPLTERSTAITSRPNEGNIQLLREFLRDRTRIVVLSGAGISVGSGIPTYRDTLGNWKRSDPIQHQDFLSNSAARQRYWLRSYAGWPTISSASPSASHRVIAELERMGTVKLVVTQNVDRLHQKAGSQNVVDLHGRIDEVVCMGCKTIIPRQLLQPTLNALNPFLDLNGNAAPDGDADVAEDAVSQVRVPDCAKCQGILKPNVVFFGDNVEKSLVQHVYDSISDSDGILIVGTSLKVFSGYRFCRHAAAEGKPLASINPGWSRGDDLIETMIRSNADDVLTNLLS